MVANNAPTFESSISASGATVQAEYTRRTVRCYAVQEGELGTLTSLGVQASLFLAAASAAIGYAVSIWVNGSFAATLTDKAKEALAVAPFLLMVGLGCFGFAIGYVIRGTLLWRRIVRESVPAVTQTTIVSAVGTVLGSSTVSGVGSTVSSGTSLPSQG